MPRYISKSRFKLALECVTKLYYTGKKEEYFDQDSKDPFLEALAKGGFQVGELAKYYFCGDPIAENITIDTLNHREALEQTNMKLAQPGRVVIAEAAFLFENLFVRADIVVKENNTLYIYEVKAKSVDDKIETDLSFLNQRGTKIDASWQPYLYDIAFQKYVISESNWVKENKFKVIANLLLVDKTKTATVDGLNQKFKIIKENSRPRVVVQDGLQRNQLGESILRSINCDTVIEKIWNDFPVPTDLDETCSFHSFIEKISNVYVNDTRFYSGIGSKCKSCQFKHSDAENLLKSGFHECWREHTGLSDEQLKEDLVTEIWGGGSGSTSHTNNLIQHGIYLLKNAKEDILSPKSSNSPERTGLSAHQRRMEQVTRMQNANTASYFDRDGLSVEMNSWNYPLHMIDFETSMVALPFHEGLKPYEGIAFQFSHHIIYDDGRVEHKGQFLATEPGAYPNYGFLRALKQELENDNGTIFRYHNHENTYLLHIADQLERDANPPADRQALLNFINTITRKKIDNVYVYGERAMVDLYDLVIRFYYPPYAKGSNSLKKILPSIIRDSQYLQEKYGRKGVYGRELEVRSLNFDDHVWITQETGMDPYKTLPLVFDGYSRDELDALVKDMEELGDGGAALTAYNYLQFSEVPLEQRERIASALLRYCELDTMAMIMLVEGWKEMIR